MNYLIVFLAATTGVLTGHFLIALARGSRKWFDTVSHHHRNVTIHIHSAVEPDEALAVKKLLDQHTKRNGGMVGLG
jgi:hypothetical protein